MSTSSSILKQYWGYNSFRPVQEEIIEATLAGKDVLALLPTGGGKSICFQVPAMMQAGICIVITPLIALMKDQVEHLSNKGIKAIAIYSGLSRKEIDIKLDNCAYGDIKFLYVSPERLQTGLFRERVKKMKVNLIAVDEAHCISQWGYDFRPAYLHIAELKELLPGTNILALTATATPEVREDIQRQLDFKEAEVFVKSFARSNLSYAVRKEENKEKKLLEVLRNVKGTAIVYARTRKGTKDIAGFLINNGIPADYYHAGLLHEMRSAKQDNWIKNKKRVIVATNAFGMGIDKSDVRVVVHMELPQDLESYYQEAGRAGRDEKKAYAVIIYQDLDIDNLKKRIQQQHPSIDYLKQVYQALANHYQLAVGSGLGQAFDFELQDFSEAYQLNHMEVYHALRKLEEEELIQFNESFYNPSQVHIAVDNNELYKFQIANASYDPFIKTLLRLYGGGVFNNFVKISEAQLAKAVGVSEKETIKILETLNQRGYVDYDKKKEKPQIIFTKPREAAATLTLDRKRLANREKTAHEKLTAMIDYVQHTARCRTQLLLEYFGETSYEPCGVCDYCVEQKKHAWEDTIEKYHHQAMVLLSGTSMTVEDLMEQINPREKESFLEVVREMVDSGVLKYDNQWRLMINNDTGRGERHDQ